MSDAQCSIDPGSRQPGQQAESVQRTVTSSHRRLGTPPAERKRQQRDDLRDQVVAALVDQAEIPWDVAVADIVRMGIGGVKVP